MTSTLKSASDNKASFINQLFNDIAYKYDLLNNLMSLGAHKRWKEETIKLALDKIDNPQEDVDQANFWFMRPTAIEAEDKDSPIVLTSSMPKFMGRKKRRGRRPKSVEQHTVDTKEGRQITVGKDGVVTSVKKTGDEDE